MMQRYRKMKEDATPVISRDDVPIIDQVAAAEVSQVENMNPDVPIPDEVLDPRARRGASRQPRAQALTARLFLPSLPRKETLAKHLGPPHKREAGRFRLNNHAAM